MRSPQSAASRRAARRAATHLTATLLAVGALSGCGDDEPGSEEPTSSPSATTTVTEDASTGATADPSPTAAEGTGDTGGVAVPVYYVGRTPMGQRLYREFNRVAGVDPLVGAAAAVTEGDPVDPDYRTLWPAGRFTSVTEEADAIVLELPDESWLRAGTLSKAQARLAVQQLVYTLQGVAGKRLPLKVELDGKPAATLLGVDAAKGLTARPQIDVLALVNVTEPAQGTAVGKSFLAEGRASSFEGTVVWEITDATGKVVLNGSAQAEGWMDKLYPWSTEISTSSLAPGSYTFVARTDDPSDGEGFGPTEDTKQITVQ